MKKVKKPIACLLAALLIFSTVPMSALADEAAAPITVETVTEEAAPNTEPDAEPKPESTAEPTATPEASAKPSTEPTAEPSPEATEEPTESEVSAEPEATAEPTASPTPNPEDEISLLALGDEAITRYRTVGINGNFSSNYLYDLGEFPLYDIYRNGVSYPAYCLQHGKGRVNNGAYVQRDNYGMTEAMRRIIAYGYNTTNSLGKNDWYSDATAKTMVTQHLVWLASEGYITVDGTNWSWGSGIDTDVERMANLAYNGSVVRSYYAELKDRLLRSEIVPSFAGKSSDGSDAQEIDLQLVTGKYTATVTDTNGVLDLFDFQQAGFDISRNGNTLTISTSTLPEQETTIIGAGYTVGDKNSIAVWEDRDQQANIQHQATCPGTTQTMAYIKIKGEKPSYTITLNKTSADLTITNGNPNYSLEGAVYYVYEYVNTPDYPYWDYEPYATFTTNANGHAELSKKLSPNDYVTIEQVAPLGYTLDTSVHRFSVDGKNTDIPVVDDPTKIRFTVRKRDADTNSNVPQGDATLEGAQYRITYTNNGEEIENVVTTNRLGQAVLRNIPIGVLVTVKEISVPLGYKLDSRVHTYITTTDTKELEYDLIPEDFTEEVMKGQIALHKQYETLDDLAEEQGAEFDVYLKSAGSYDAAKETERDHITTGADGMATTKDLPYGTYVVHQTKGGNGRQLVADFDVVISEDGKVYSYDLVNVQKNAQLKIVKTSEDGVIEGIKFRVTRLEDSYSAEYVTNAAGEILTETLPIYADKDGATKYQYKVEELDTEETFGYQLPDSQTVELSEGEIASVSFHNKPIEIGTKATVEGEKEIDPLDKVTLTDTVSYIGLVPGKEYKVVGVLMDKLIGEKLLVNGQEIIAETTFIADAKNGSVDVTFVFDATGLHGKEIVVFEDLYRENIKVAAHADINDESQTIKVKPLHGSVSLTKSSTMDDTKRLTGAEFTVYSDANGNGIYEADTDVKVDTLTDLGNGEYKLNGLLYGKYLLVETKAPNRYYADEKVYAFAIEHDGDAVVISNNDKNNLFVDQPKIGKITLRYDEKTTPNSPKTGSSSNVGYWLAMLCVSAAGLIAAIVEKKKGKKPHLLSFLVAGVIAVAAVGMVADPVSADSVDLGNGNVDVNGNTATVTRTVTSDDKTTEAAFDDEITYDGKTYKLDRVDSYVTDEKAVEEEKEVSATEEILTGTKESKFPEAISKDFSGDKVVLQYVDTKYTETKLPEFKADITESVVLGTATSQPEAAQSITVKYHSDEYGIDVDVPLQLDHVENNGYTWTSDLSVPMTLYGIDSAYLQFGDALIPYDGGNPPLTGYESAYLASLGLSANSYRLSRVTWDGDAYTNADGELCRNAIVTGDRLLSTFTAVYGGKNVTVPSVDGYKATATYSGTQIVKTDKTEYSIRSVATYIEQNNEVPVAVIVGITIGTIALAAAIVIILFIISKKRKEKEAEQ